MPDRVALTCLLLALSLLACAERPPSPAAESMAAPAPPAEPAPSGTTALATFAGGCFWCMEPPFEGRAGIIDVVSGYAGGTEPDPTYHQVSGGQTSHTEAVQITYDPGLISYEQLLDIYWKSFDPTDATGQFADRGAHYRPEIFVHDDAQRVAAEASKARLEALGVFDERVAVPVTRFTTFYPAEEYHQDYYKKNPGHYGRYSAGSGRKGFLRRTWGDDAQGGKSRE